MTHDTWTDRLSAYLDDDLSPAGRLEMERHLIDCADCRDALEQLRGLVVEAGRLSATAPERNLWPSIEAAIVPEDPQASAAWRRRVSVPLPIAIAAGALLAVTSALGAWMVSHRPAPAADVAAATALEAPVSRPISLAPVPYGHAVDDLMTALSSRRDQLNPRTVQALERSLTTIDTAIADAMAVLAEQPDDLALVARVADQRRLKLAVLRRFEKLTVSDSENAQ